MSDAPGQGRRTLTRKGSDGTHNGNHRKRFVRHAHIFASTVREILEMRLLRESTSLPLTLCQFHVLRLMALNGRHQVGEVADFLGVSAPAATKNIDKLERLGLMERHPSKGDRRAKLLTVSARGRALVGEYDQVLDRCLGAALADFPAGETNRLSSLLERFFISLLKGEGMGRSRRFCLRCAGYLDDACPVGRLRGGCPYQEFGRPGDPDGAPGRKSRETEPGRPDPSRQGQTNVRRGC